MPRQSYLHFVDEAMSTMQYRKPNVSNRTSAHMPHSGHVTGIDASSAMSHSDSGAAREIDRSNSLWLKAFPWPSQPKIKTDEQLPSHWHC
jgi:hypothetical protein